MAAGTLGQFAASTAVDQPHTVLLQELIPRIRGVIFFILSSDFTITYHRHKQDMISRLCGDQPLIDIELLELV